MATEVETVQRAIDVAVTEEKLVVQKGDRMGSIHDNYVKPAQFMNPRYPCWIAKIFCFM